MSDFGRLQELARAAGVQVNPPSVVDIPMISPETAAVGDTLSCTMGNWNGEPSEYAYQWLSNGTDTTATGASYSIPPGDDGHVITCVVTATNAAGSATASPSNAVTVTATRAAPAKKEPEPVHHPDAHSDARRK
jgi:hypothetical protein